MRLVLTALLTLAAATARAAPPAATDARSPLPSTAQRAAPPAGARPPAEATKAPAASARSDAPKPAASPAPAPTPAPAPAKKDGARAAPKKKVRAKVAEKPRPAPAGTDEAAAPLVENSPLVATDAPPAAFDATWAAAPSSTEASAQLAAVSPLDAAAEPVVEPEPAAVVAALGTLARLEVSFATGVSELGVASFTRGAAAVQRGALRPGRGRLIAARASRLVGTRNLHRVYRRLPDDCSGLVRAAYEDAGIDLVSHGFERGENAVSAIYRLAEERGALHRRRPRPGDLVFFRETYDRNRDGKRNDGLTHIAVVERVDRDGTVTFVHRASRGVTRSQMNLRAPRVHRTGDGRVLNDYLRAASRRSRAWLTGELFIAYASPERL